MADEEEKPVEAPVNPTLPNQGNLTPFPGGPPVGNIYTDYNPKGAMGGLFAPAFIRGFAPAEEATDKWQQERAFSRQDVENTRMPYEWEAPQAINPMAAMGGGMGGYIGGNEPTRQTFGDKRGLVDVNALYSQAQGLPYDKEARRAAIAERVAANAAQQESYAQQHEARYGYRPEEGPRGPYAGNGPQGGNTMFANMGGDPGWQQAQMMGGRGLRRAIPPGTGEINAPGWGMYGG